jgi:hypothetical protein
MATKPTSLRPSLDSNAMRAAYSAAAAVAVASAAQAGVVYSGVQNISINQFNSLNLDIDLDGSGDLLLKNYVFGGGNYQGASVNFAPGKLVGFNAGLSYASALDAGFSVDAGSVGPTFFGSMAYGASNPMAQFNNVAGKFLGLSFAGNTGLKYAWVRVDINNASGSFVVRDWAYESTNGIGITTGVIPGPGALGLLAVGAAGLGRLRSRRDRQ